MEGVEAGMPPLPATKALIFKVGDDCRQDLLALQVIQLLKRAFDAAVLPVYLAPYGAVPTGHEQGIIEVVPNSKSRAQLGEIFDGGLFEIFQHEFGMPGSKRFEVCVHARCTPPAAHIVCARESVTTCRATSPPQAARAAFVASNAAYAVATMLIWAKDRHNGNLMLDNKGHFIHIDFGYILGISPGERAGCASHARIGAGGAASVGTPLHNRRARPRALCRRQPGL